ncbi:hypothetical protein [Clostridium sp. BNL1100]|uniref:hypothetical protein n=1 Tax=Clostridium sp. BNL1100 TaxID=755731 RepID=UPI00024A77AA|nr:hypothetical protein [Clostridium sp. BNL1100]AEY64805.1 hypothetical protein Clo1100_0525 [Clostridium sp. BNL1100]
MFKVLNAISDINRFFRKNYIWFFPVIALLFFELFFWIININGKLDLTKVDQNAILTINLTLAGFLLTGIGIMISIRDKSFIQTLIKAGYWAKIERSVFWGIAFHVLSALFALVTLITRTNNIIIFNIENASFLFGLTYFIIVVVWLKKALRYI